MKAAAVGLGVAMVVGAAIYGQPQPVELVPKLEPVVVQPLPPLEVPLPKARPKAVEKQPKAKPKPKVAGVSCAEARQGVGMSCFMIRANSWRYEQMSPEQKAHADSCLTAAERTAIRACFQ